MRFKQLEALRSVIQGTYTALKGEDLGISKDINETDRILEQNGQKRNCDTGNTPHPIPTKLPCSIVIERLSYWYTKEYPSEVRDKDE